MKKFFIALASLSVIFLLACSAQKEQVNGEENTGEIASVENDIPKEYEEISKISEKINVQDYSMHVESDNKETRIILFEKNGKKMYKSVFVKEKKYLKLIDLELGQKPLINENI